MSQKNKNEPIEQAERLQAIVILETYNSGFKPINLDTPECLLPLLGKPLIEYTLEFLYEQKVEELFLFCTNHYERIREYLNSTKWNKRFDLHLHQNVGCVSFGDSMREIKLLFETKGLARSNFILVTAPAIIANNFKITKLIEAHKQRSKTDKNSIMTLICPKKLNDVSLSNSSIANHADTLLIHNSSNCVLHYDYDESKVKAQIPLTVMEYLTSLDVKSTKVGAPSVAKSSSTLKMRTDLFDSHIYLCNSYVLPIFSDNFEKQTMCEFISGIIADEISGYTIYLETIDHQFDTYLSIITDLNSYYFETIKLLQRLHSFEKYKSNRIRSLNDSLNVFFNKSSVDFGQNVILRRNVFIEEGCKLGDNCELINCFVGKNCQIAPDVHISNSIILENTIIGSKTTINACLLGSNMRVGENCTFVENSLFSNNCHVKDNAVFETSGIYYADNADDDYEDGSKSGSESNGSESTDNKKKVAADKNTPIISNFSRYQYSSQNDTSNDDDSDDEDEAASEKHENETRSSNKLIERKHFYVWPIRKERQALEDSDDEEDSDTYSIESRNGSSSDEDLLPDEVPESDDDEVDAAAAPRANIDEDELKFFNETKDVLERTIKEKLSVDDTVIQINGSKHAYHILIDDVCYYLIQAILELPISKKQLIQKELCDKEPYLDLVKSVITRFKSLLEVYFGKTRQSQLALLNGINEFMIDNEPSLMAANYMKVLHFLNQEVQILDDKITIDWYKQQVQQNTSDQEKKNSLESISRFVQWLEEAESESDDDDEDDE